MNDRKMFVYWRRPYELYSAFCWLLGAVITALYGLFGDFGFRFLFLATVPMFFFACVRFYDAFTLLSFKAGLQTQPDLNIDLEWLVRKQKANPDMYYAGHGFTWTQEHTQKVKDYYARDVSLFKVNSLTMTILRLFGMVATQKESHPTVCHGMGEERPIYLPIKGLYQHRGIIGTTGAGKGLFQRIQILSCIVRNEAVINLDPKTDTAIVDVAYGTMKLMGPERERAFYYFSSTYPNSSIRIDLLANYSNLSQLATRIINILPPSDDEAFKNFSWRAILAILHAMKVQGIKPSLLGIRKAISTNFSYLVKDASLHYFEQVKVPESKLKHIRDMDAPQDAADECVNYYEKHLKERKNSRDLEQLFAFFSLDKSFMDKLIQNIIPILEMLTAPPLDKLLSPQTDDLDPRPIITLQTVVNTRGFLYVNLAALSDVRTAQALGALLINDTTNVVANRYFFEDDGGASIPMNVFIDEASSVISHSVLAVANQSRGAYTSLNMAFQTIPDLEVRLGTPAAGEIVLGNMMNKTCFRIADETTQKYMATQFGETTIKKMDYGFVTQQTTIKDLDFNNSYSKQISHEDVELVPPSALKDLPVGHCFTVCDEVYKLRIPFIEVSEDLRYKRVVYHEHGSVNLPSLQDISTSPIGVMEFTQEVNRA